ncbi:MAG: ATP-dependent helicase, partial [Erysipelothrix sp.]|nr:ATP-dependent helicase [Erysipelothrix sp.]
DRNHKIDLLADLFKKERLESILIFTRTKQGANNVVKDLEKRKIKAQAMHGNKSQNARQDALETYYHESPEP